MAQQAFGSHNHQRARRAREVESLAAQDVEVLSGSRAVDNAPVISRGERQVAFQAGAGVLRPLALVSMWQQQDQRGFLKPLAAPGRDKLVDNNLSYIGEISVLRLPENQSFGSMHAIPVFKAHDRGFAQWAVIDGKRGFCLR